MAAVTGKPLVDIAESLVQLARRLSEQLMQAASELPAPPPIMMSVDRASAMLHDRSARRDFLPAALFHEPAWEILLILYIAANDGATASLKQVSAQVHAPGTTTQRWVDQLVQLGLVARGESLTDRRRVELSLTGACRAQLDAYFAALPPVAAR